MTSEPCEILGPDRPGAWLVACDHASNAVPACVAGGSLGLAAEDMARHIAWDIGAAGVTRHLAQRLDAPAVLSRFSRLVIDPNRGEDDPTLIMRLYDGTIIPANRHVDAAERERRLRTFYRPYHAALAERMARDGTILLAVHSFTAQLQGRPPRPWQVGVLSAHDRRLADPLLWLMARDPDFRAFVETRSGAPLCLGDNQPYGGHLPGDVVDTHALSHGRPNILLEIRNDLIGTEEAQAAWAAALAPLVVAARGKAGL